MKKQIILIILMIVLSFNITTKAEFQNESIKPQNFGEDIFDNMISLNNCNVDLKFLSKEYLLISLNGEINFKSKFQIYKSPYDNTIILESSENSDIISAQLIDSSKHNRLIKNHFQSDNYILQIIIKKSGKFYLYEKSISNSAIENLHINSLKNLPDEKLFLLDWWIRYLSPTKTYLKNSLNEQTAKIRTLDYNHRTETKTLVVRYERFDIEYRMDVCAELQTYNISKYGREEERIDLYIPSQSQYENGVYRDNRRVLLIKDPIFNFELANHYGKNNNDGFTMVICSCPNYYISRPKLKFGMSNKIWDWIEIEHLTIGGNDHNLLENETKKFGCQIIGATDAEEIRVCAILKKNTSGDYRHKLYVDIDFEYCYYNYNTVIGNEKMYIAGYIDSND